jgi:hypothetical protein
MRKFFAMLLGSAFVLLLVMTTLALGLRSFVFDADFYVSTLKAQGVFQELAKTPLDFVDLTTQIPQLATIPASLQQQVVATILPPDWLEKQAGSVIQAWLTWFSAGEGGVPKLPIDLRQIKDRLQGPPGLQVATEVVNAIPNCAPDQQPQLSLTQLPECIPQVFDRNYISEQVAGTLSAAADSLPPQYDIGSRVAAGLHFGPTFNGQRISGALFDTVLLLLAAGTIGLWVLGAISGGRTGRQRWLWLGGLLLIGAIAVLGTALLIYVFGPALTPRAWFAAMTTEVSALAHGLIQTLERQWAARAISMGVVAFVASLGLLGVGLLRPAPRVAVARRA